MDTGVVSGTLNITNLAAWRIVVQLNCHRPTYVEKQNDSSIGCPIRWCYDEVRSVHLFVVRLRNGLGQPRHECQCRHGFPCQCPSAAGRPAHEAVPDDL